MAAPAAFRLLPLLALAAACGRAEEAAGPPGSPPAAVPVPVAGAPTSETASPAVAPAPATWEGRVEGGRLVLEARPGPDGGWELASPAGSDWRLRSHRRAGGQEILDLRLGEGLAARDLRLRLVLDPEAAVLDGEATAGARRLAVRLRRR